MNTVPQDDGRNAGRVEELHWALRWLAAERDAAIAAFDGIVTGDEIALDLNWWYEVTFNWDCWTTKPPRRSRRSTISSRR